MKLKMECNWCGKEISRKRSMIKERNYCSRTCLGKANAERFRLQRLKICDYCGQEFEYKGRHKKRNIHFFCSSKCANKYKTKRMTVKCDWCDLEFEKKRSDVNRSNHNFCKPECGHSFKRWTGVCGYSPLVGGVPIHRKIMEETLGRKLIDNEEVHHIDFNHHNNHIENLVVLSKSEHSRIHAVSKERDVYGRFIDQK